MEAACPNQRERFAVIVRLSHVPKEHRHEIKDKLCIYFQSKKGGNCDVEDIRLLGEDVYGSRFRVAFAEQSGASNVLARPCHAIVIDGVKIPLEVQGCRAPPGTSVSSSLETPGPGHRPSDAVTKSPYLTAADIQIESGIYGVAHVVPGAQFHRAA